MAGKYEVKKTTNAQFVFNLKAANGEVILTSEQYTTKGAAENGIESVKKNASADERYERKEAKNGQFFFVLKAANHQVIGQSEFYKTKAAMENGIASVKKNGPDARTEDLT